MIPDDILEVLKKFNWKMETKQLLEECLEEHGENGILSCLEVALGY